MGQDMFVLQLLKDQLRRDLNHCCFAPLGPSLWPSSLLISEVPENQSGFICTRLLTPICDFAAIWGDLIGIFATSICLAALILELEG